MRFFDSWIYAETPLGESDFPHPQVDGDVVLAPDPATV